MPADRSNPRDVFRAPKGTHDVLPPQSARFEAIVGAFAARAATFGYGLILTPMFEHLEVFHRVGPTTDVAKEMYELTDKGGRRLALRPEGTAPVVRAFVEHRPTEPFKVWYAAPSFRYERPQKGRYRQHHQLGVEAIGAPDVDLDVEVIDLAYGFFAAVGLTGVAVKLNSMGDEAGRAAYVEHLRDYLEPHAPELGDDFSRMLATNPLRVLDTKIPAWRDVIERAPQLPEHLSPPALAQFEQVQAGLRAIGIPFELDPRLVRGFDYYTGTTFEFTSAALDAAQDAVGGGGRYDGLVAAMGGPDISGIGFGIGVERVLLALEAQAAACAADAAGTEAGDGAGTGDADGGGAEAEPADVFVIDRRTDSTGTEMIELLHWLRAEGLRAERAPGGRSEKAQWKVAARRRARFTVVLDVTSAAVTVRRRGAGPGEDHTVPRELLVGWLAEHAGGPSRSRRASDEQEPEARVARS